MREQFDGVSLLHMTRAHDVRIKAQPSAKPTDYVSQYRGILFRGVRVVGRHHAAPAQVGDRNLGVRQSQRGAGPLPLAGSVYAPDENGALALMCGRPCG
jgi:hypothetical protein